MYQKFHEYFKVNNIKIFLKYDGERTENIYTVMIIDKNNYQNTISKNTDTPIEVFQNFVDNLKVSDETNKMVFDTFTSLLNKLIALLDSDLVFIFTVELINDIEFYISIQSHKVTSNFRSNELERVAEFIDNLAN